MVCYAEAVPIHGDGPNEFSPYAPGEEVNYSCDDGYNLIGEATISCQPSGSWNASSPICQGNTFYAKQRLV